MHHKSQIPIEQHIRDVAAYAKEMAIYETFAEFLTQVLKKAAEPLAPLSIVQARAKTVSSFAQKIIRKDKYVDPLKEVTDLCGARVIVHFQNEVVKLCQFIKDHFIIDEANSIDIGSRLREEEFGYLSFHYIVTPPRGFILGMKVPDALTTRKAEIQVRTLLQHAWADISHDRIYKSNLTVPRRWRRESARLAAVLEKADDAFARMSETLDAFSSNYNVLLCEKKLGAEIQTLTTIHDVEPDSQNRPVHALKLARAYAAAGDWAAIVNLLKPYLSTSCSKDLVIDYAFALCRHQKGDLNSVEFKKGQEMLHETVIRPSSVKQESETEADSAKHQLARAWHLLGCTQSWMPAEEKATKASFRAAYELMPANPYYFMKFIEYEIKSHRDLDFLAMLTPGIRQAIAACRNHIEIGLELVNAYFAIAKAHFILSQPDQCLNAYAKIIDLLLNEESCVPQERLDEELQALSHLKRIDSNLYQLGFILLHLARWLRFSRPDSEQIVRKSRLKKNGWREPVLIIAGGAEAMSRLASKRYHSLIREVLDYYQGTVISGGTTSGIPGEVGIVAEQLKNQGCREFELIGYLPRRIPDDAEKCRSYDELLFTEGYKEFSARELIAYWIDLIAAGVDPANVLVLGINGGHIADLEYRLALAFGAVVGVVQNSGRAAAGLLNDPDWKTHKRIIELAENEKIVWAFVRQHQPVQLTQKEVEELAEKAHGYYLNKRIEQKNTSDKAMLPWDKLPDTLVTANRQQIIFIEKVMKKLGLAIRPAATPAPYPFTEEQKEQMAEIEHARWCVERGLDGWRFGSTKDVEKKINPSLVPWERLPGEIRVYDREAVAHFEEFLNQAKFEIYEPKEKK